MKQTEQTEQRTFLGLSNDATGREVKMYADSETFYGIYYEGTSEEWVVSKSIQEVNENPDKFIYTPFAFFISYNKK